MFSWRSTTTSVPPPANGPLTAAQQGLGKMPPKSEPLKLAPIPLADSVYNIVQLASKATEVTGTERDKYLVQLVHEFNRIDPASTRNFQVTLIQHTADQAADVQRHAELQGWKTCPVAITPGDLLS